MGNQYIIPKKPDPPKLTDAERRKIVLKHISIAYMHKRATFLIAERYETGQVSRYIRPIEYPEYIDEGIILNGDSREWKIVMLDYSNEDIKTAFKKGLEWRHKFNKKTKDLESHFDGQAMA